MTQLTTYNCDTINSQRLFIPDLRAYLKDDNSYLHFIKGALLCFCRQGSATIKVNYSTYSLNSRNTLAILPTHVLSIENSSENAVLEAILYSDEYWTSIVRSVDYQIFKAAEFQPLVTLPDDTRQEAHTLLDLVKRHDVCSSGSSEVISRSVASGLAFSLLMLIVSVINFDSLKPPTLASRKEELTHDFFELLSKYYETERQVSFYASKLCVTPKHLSTMVKEVTRQSILDWINNVTVLNIKHRLRTTSDSILQISEALNFQTPSTFVRYFRQHTGVTPAKYRAEQHSI